MILQYFNHTLKKNTKFKYKLRSRVATGQEKIREIQGQGKVREF